MKSHLRILILVIPSILGWELNAQMIMNRNCEAFTESPYFDTAFIRKNHIFNLHGVISIKKEKDMVRETDMMQYFEFDRKGRLIKQMYSHHKFGSRLDTTTILYEYDKQGRVITRRQNDNLSFYSYNYQYDSLGRIVKETYTRDENCGPNKYKFVLGKQYEITSEKYTYEKASDGRLKKYYYNSLDRPYMESYYKYDEYNFLIHEERMFSMTARKVFEASYGFSEAGRVNYKKEITNFNTGAGMEYKYVYDDKGNLTELREVKEGVETMYRELLYDGHSGLLHAVLSKDQRTRVISILKFTYDFYP